AAVKMYSAGNPDAVLLVRGADRRPVVRHFDDSLRRWGRNLDGNGGVGVRDADFWFGFGLCGRGIGDGLLLQPIELVLQQPELLLQRGDLIICRACRLRTGLRNSKCRDQCNCNLRTLCSDSHSALPGIRMMSTDGLSSPVPL